MKPSSWDKQLGLVSPRENAASQSDQTNNPSKNEVRSEVGLDVSHHARISQRGGEMLFFLTSPFIGLSEFHYRCEKITALCRELNRIGTRSVMERRPQRAS